MDKLREVRISGYRLTIWDSHRMDWRGKSYLGYRLSRGKQMLFEGEDFAGSPLHADDSDETVKALLSFLTLRKGDTDAEYFDSYTPEQLAWRDSEAESLAMAVYDRFGE